MINQATEIEQDVDKPDQISVGDIIRSFQSIKWNLTSFCLSIYVFCEEDNVLFT